MAEDRFCSILDELGKAREQIDEARHHLDKADASVREAIRALAEALKLAAGDAAEIRLPGNETG